MEARIKAENIFVSFDNVKALKGVSLEIYPGEVLALVGDNGAGKSTLIKVISGALQADSGKIYINGEEIKFNNPAVARENGIQTVYQDLALANDLDITANLFLGRESIRKNFLGKLGFLDNSYMENITKKIFKKLNVPINEINQKTETLSGGQRQSVAIARAVAWGQELIIMDEPTAALGVEETSNVLSLIREARDMGTPLLLISHNLPQVFEVADRIMVLRLGKRVANLTIKDTSMDEIVSLMTGSKTYE